MAAVAGLSVLPAATAGAAAPASGSAQAVVNQAVSSTNHAPSGRVAITVTHDGSKSVETIDIGPHGGMATANEGGQVLHILYTQNTIYLQGKAAVLTSVLGMPANEADKYGGKWLAASTSVGGMSQLAQLFSLSTFGNSLVNLTPPLARSGGTGQSAIKVTGTIPKTTVNESSGGDRATLLVSPSGAHYPVSVTYGDKTEGTTHVVFSNWGERVTVAAPANAVPSSQWLPASSGS